MELKPAPKTTPKAKRAPKKEKKPNQLIEELREKLAEELSNLLLGEKIPLDMTNVFTREIIIPANRKITKTLIRKLVLECANIDIDPSPLRNKIAPILLRYSDEIRAVQPLASDKEGVDIAEDKLTTPHEVYKEVKDELVKADTLTMTEAQAQAAQMLRERQRKSRRTITRGMRRRARPGIKKRAIAYRHYTGEDRTQQQVYQSDDAKHERGSIKKVKKLKVRMGYKNYIFI